MKKYLYTLFLLLPLGLMGCSEREQWAEDNEGSLRLNIGIESDLAVSTRALSTADEDALKAACRIRIFDGETLIRKYEGLSTMPADGLQLMAGANYSVRITAGDSVAAAFDKRFFEGKQPFEIVKGQTTPVSVTCKIVNTLVKVKFAPNLSNVFSNYQLKVSTPTGSLDFTTENEGAIGYYILPEGCSALTWKFTATTLNGASYVKEGTYNNVSAATLYAITCNFETSSSEEGGATIGLEVDETPIDEIISDVVIFQRPTITGMNSQNEKFDLVAPTYLEIGAGSELSLWIATSCPLASAVLSCNEFTSWGFPVNSLDLVILQADEKELLNQAGLVITNRYEIGEDPTTGRGNMGIRFTDKLIQNITQTEGSHSIMLTAIDKNGSQRSVEWKIVVSNATIVTEDVIVNDIWTSKAVLRASIAKEPSNILTFRYRKTGTLDWTSVAAVRNGNSVSAEITGLEAGTRYEYQALDGDAASGVTCAFTTEAKRQLENAGFENWSSSTPTLIYGSGQSMWWDSGNHGSATMSKDLTTADGGIKHSGNYSAKLKSQFVGLGTIGKFAAGNLFVGKYLKTVGTSGGIIGWGREFNTRPKALRGWIKYEAGIVNYGGSQINKGATDQGQVFIALGDWEGTYESNTKETWPVVINNTSASGLFDASENNTGIIAYGEYTWMENTTEEGLIEFIINLDYRSDRKPTSIVLVASASKFGDYFQGSSGSTMWLDDFELIYE